MTKMRRGDLTARKVPQQQRWWEGVTASLNRKERTQRKWKRSYKMHEGASGEGFTMGNKDPMLNPEGLGGRLDTKKEKINMATKPSRTMEANFEPYPSRERHTLTAKKETRNRVLRNRGKEPASQVINSFLLRDGTWEDGGQLQ